MPPEDIRRHHLGGQWVAEPEDQQPIVMRIHPVACRVTTQWLHVTIKGSTGPRGVPRTSRLKCDDTHRSDHFLVIGAIAGWIAGLIVKAGYGLVGDIVVGVIGSLIGWLIRRLGIAVGGLIGSIIAAVVGAIILLALLRLIKRA
jgi:uncharacterized membrane protein YeaQ/YmgE (transglycosylase-associated protein family)